MLDMVRSLGLVAIAVVGMVVFTQRNEPAHPPVPPETQQTVEAARSHADFPVLAAMTVPTGIYANAARYDSSDGKHWHFYIGYTDGFSGYLSVEAATDGQVRAPFPDAAPVTTQHAAGISFDVYAESEVEVWFHPSTSAEPFAMQISCNALDSCDEIRQALSASGPVATDGSSTTS